MKIGDLVRRTVPIPGIEKIHGIVIKTWAHNNQTYEVMWPDGGITMPFKANFKVVTVCDT